MASWNWPDGSCDIAVICLHTSEPGHSCVCIVVTSGELCAFLVLYELSSVAI